MLTDFADEVCAEQDKLVVPVEGKSDSFQLTGKGQVAIEGLVSKLVSAGVEGAGAYQSKSNALILQNDLKEVILSGAGCRERIVDKFERRFLGEDKSNIESITGDGASFSEELSKFNEVCGTYEGSGRFVMNTFVSCREPRRGACLVNVTINDDGYFAANKISFDLMSISGWKREGANPRSDQERSIYLKCGLGTCVDDELVSYRSDDGVPAPPGSNSRSGLFLVFSTPDCVAAFASLLEIPEDQ